MNWFQVTNEVMGVAIDVVGYLCLLYWAARLGFYLHDLIWKENK